MQKIQDAFCTRYVDRFQLRIDPDWSIRETRLYILEGFLNSTIYDNLSPYHYEYAGGQATGTYVPLAKRRPSVIYPLPKIIVDESVSMLFGEGHFPIVRGGDESEEEAENFLQYITRVSNLQSAMIEAARLGSIGSVAVYLKVLDEKFYFDILNTKYLTPYFNQKDPDTLLRLVEKLPIDGSSLEAMGYPIQEDQKNEFFYLKREWNLNEEIYYFPYLKDDDSKIIPMKDDERSSFHGLGFVPIIWIKNLPKCGFLDGCSTFESIVDISIEINYQLSQLGRGLKYNSDPTLVIKNPVSLQDNQLVKGIGALTLDEKGDAFLLEMNGSSTKAVIDFVNLLRQAALEAVRGDRSNPDKISGLHSGKALQMLNAALIALVAELRLSYGEKGLLRIYQMIVMIANMEGISIDAGKVKVPKIDDLQNLILDWPDWYAPTPQDSLQKAQALQTLRGAEILSQQSAMESIADQYNILNVDEEMSRVEKEQKTAYDMEMKVKSGVDRQTGDVDRN